MLEYKIKSERLQAEINKYANLDLGYKKENLIIQSKNDELTLKLNKLYEKEQRYDDEIKNMNSKIADVERHYEDVIREKEEEIAYVNKKLNNTDNDMTRNNIIIEKLTDFINKNLKYLTNKEDDHNYNNSSFKLAEIEGFLSNIDKFIQRIINDNRVLMNKLNEFNEEKTNTKKVNEMINDLKVENTLLK